MGARRATPSCQSACHLRGWHDGGGEATACCNDEVPERSRVPALDATPPAGPNSDAFPRGARKGILQWIEPAKTPATRAKRVAETVAKAAQNERANQWAPKETR